MKKRTVYLNKFGQKLACVLPRSLAISVAKVDVVWRFLRKKREKQVVKKNLRYCGIKDSNRNVFKTFFNYGISLTDTFRSLNYDNASLEKMVEFNGRENLSQALKLNRGVILITAHLGNWNLAGIYLASLGYPVTAVVEEIPGLSDIFNRIRSRTGMEIVYVREKDRMYRALENNRILALLGDRDLTGRGLRVKFLDGEKTVPRGTAAFALKYKAPICFGRFVLTKDKEGKKIYQAEISEPLIPKGETQGELLQVIADRLSNYVRQFPTQWFVLDDEWLNPINN